MSDYRIDIDEHNDITYLHVMIDPGEDNPGSPYLVSTHIPLDVIQTAIKQYRAKARASEIAARRSQGARDGWEIRHAKMGGKQA